MDLVLEDPELNRRESLLRMVSAHEFSSGGEDGR